MPNKLTKIFFGDNLALLRKKKNWSQEELASHIGVKRTTITNYEKGKSQPEFKTFVAIVILFDINAHDLIFKDLSKEDGHPAQFEADDGKVDLRYIIELQKQRIAYLEARQEKPELSQYIVSAPKKKKAG